MGKKKLKLTKTLLARPIRPIKALKPITEEVLEDIPSMTKWLAKLPMSSKAGKSLGHMTIIKNEDGSVDVLWAPSAAAIIKEWARWYAKGRKKRVE